MRAETLPERRALTDTPILIPAIGADGALYPIEKLRAHQEKRLHLAVSIFLFDGDRLLIQRRAAAKYHCGGLWANTCCTHPDWGETVEDAARRRLSDELGVVADLHPTARIDYSAAVTNDLHEHERVTVFRGEVDRRRLAMRLNPDEVSEIDWARISDLRAESAADPSRFAPWFRIYLKRWDELGLDP